MEVQLSKSQVFKFSWFLGSQTKAILYPDLRGEATIDEEIKPGREGRIRFRGSFWPARCEHPISLPPGQMVVVRGVLKGSITLVVEPVNSELFIGEVS